VQVHVVCACACGRFVVGRGENHLGTRNDANQVHPLILFLHARFDAHDLHAISARLLR
jgi:hypothetical protein